MNGGGSDISTFVHKTTLEQLKDIFVDVDAIYQTEEDEENVGQLEIILDLIKEVINRMEFNQQ